MNVLELRAAKVANSFQTCKDYQEFNARAYI